MKYIKSFESIGDFISEVRNTYMYGKDMLFINDIMNYLKVDTQSTDEQYKPESPYDVDVIDFFKEIFVDKYILFTPLDRYKNYKTPFNVKVEDVKCVAYKDDVYIKIKTYDVDLNKWLWYILKNDEGIFLKNYDADTKPLHKEVAMKKDAEKYNV